MERGITVDEPIDVCFKKHRLPPRSGNQGDAQVVFTEGIPGGIDAFLTKCGHRWLLRGDASVDERKHGKADDSVGTSGYFVEIQPQHVPFVRPVLILRAVSRQRCLEE